MTDEPRLIHVCQCGDVIRVYPGRTEVVLLSGHVVAGVPQRNDDQAATAAELGYGTDVEGMVEDHDPLHALLCDWLGIGESFALRIAAGELPEDHALAYLEEDAVLAVQRFMVAAGGHLPMRKSMPG